MKRTLLSCILFILTSFSIIFGQDSTSVRNENERLADIAYNSGDFQQAIDLLEKEKDAQLAKGLESADLYYNLGNAYFRENNLGKARLYYEKALLLNPGDKDIRHNIEYLSTKIEDKILVADTFFLNIWFSGIQNLYNSNTWAKMAIVSFLLFMVCLFLYFFSKKIMIKKASFYTGIILLIFVIFANIFSLKQKYKIKNRNTAVIMAASVPIVSSPDLNSKELFTLHAGTKVHITKQDHNWLEIEIDNGNIGWIQRDKLEII